MNRILFSILGVVGICLFSVLGVKKETSKQSYEFKKVEDAVLASGSLLRLTDYESENITPRPVDVWLPENYSEHQKYKVLYMHDGQNLFDSTTTWNKREWKVDEWLTKLTSEEKMNDIIVVGIHNIPKLRWQDLFPEKAFEYMPDQVRDSLLEAGREAKLNLDFRGDEYLKFIVKELKPQIDAQFSTQKDENYVAGSSMGGLMSMYAMVEYPDVFKGAGCLSTHWVGALPTNPNPFPEAIFKYMEDNLTEAEGNKFYFDYGDKTLDKYYPKFAPRVDAIFKAKGYSEDNFKNLYFEGTKHSEESWNKRLDQPFTFLFGKP
ncbi:alpha/beta hydrolase-fold protein [Winogradskyella maritima]|uniref:Alpha/beta hydrolase n=1 Tax=Winogradskyella maritima TaxID=1517766 RepID=A0ABV8AGE7_9FLAO|nr:alpha/beta hydrolase-fold protein [Winogradskyella maritima]